LAPILGFARVLFFSAIVLLPSGAAFDDVDVVGVGDPGAPQ
jgi:hypothetical protein